jgi:peptidoglycan/xylan/chitin deacetylase (PgdA/CDA1 family)
VIDVMSSVTLKIDVDTLRGTREGVPRLAELLRKRKIPATFLFSLGPDHTGRALRRIFRRGFLSKVRRTSVRSHYGLRTLLYGTLLPGPDIGRLCSDRMLDVVDRGFEVGVHAWDHVKWQDGVTRANLEWTRRELTRAVEAFERIFKFSPRVHGAAGWQVNEHVPALLRQFGFQVSSDTRGTRPFIASEDGVVQFPTTLPTLDELIGVSAATADEAVRQIFDLSRAGEPRHHVFTLHAELEGGRLLPQFDRLLRLWRDAGVEFQSLGAAAESLDRAALPRSKIRAGAVPGRSGTVALQTAS